MITKEEFESYVDCQESGVTNMFMLSNIMAITGLSKDKCFEIMNKYSELKEKFK